MSEADYITVSNLARVRSALGILRDYAPTGAPHDDLYQRAITRLSLTEIALSDLVVITEDEPA